MGFSEMMAQEVLGPHRVPAYAGCARDIHASGRHLLALADDLLDLARIESGHRTLMETAVDLDALAEDCRAMIEPIATAAGVVLSCATGAAPRLWVDERALRQIALNLLGNAVKFTPSAPCGSSARWGRTAARSSPWRIPDRASPTASCPSAPPYSAPRMRARAGSTFNRARRRPRPGHRGRPRGPARRGAPPHSGDRAAAPSPR